MSLGGARTSACATSDVLSVFAETFAEEAVSVAFCFSAGPAVRSALQPSAVNQDSLHPGYLRRSDIVWRDLMSHGAQKGNRVRRDSFFHIQLSRPPLVTASLPI